jgi:uncharacterized protein YkuJ
MKLLQTESEPMIRQIYYIEIDGEKYCRIEFENSKGKVVDFITRDENGFEVDDIDLNEQIDEFLNELDKVQ